MSLNFEEEYFSGKRLYGNDFNSEQIDEWFADEKEGYANLGSKDQETYKYMYHELNIKCGYSNLDDPKFDNVLSIGSAYGDEFHPIAHRVRKLTVLDPSDSFSAAKNEHFQNVEWIKPNSNGVMPFKDNTFDLVVCFGVLHHIPNVGFVLNEIHRCLKNGGTFIVREPITSMGDWRKPRIGLTKRERGIPINLLLKMSKNAGFSIEKKVFCMFNPLPKLLNYLKLKVPTYNSKFLTNLDIFLSHIFSFNQTYHRKTPLKKIAPSSIFMVLRKEVENK